MAPEAQECGGDMLPEAALSEVDPVDNATPTVSQGPSCCPCCRSWQRRKRQSRKPRGTDKVGPTDNQTLLSGGATRFYCCDSKMLTRPTSGPNRVRSTNNPPETVSEAVEEATPVSPGLCSFLRFREPKCSASQSVDTEVPVDVAFDAFDVNAYLDEFELIHHEDYDIRNTVRDPDIPYYEVLEQPSLVGRVIVIDGVVLSTAQRFAVNLVCSERGDIAMHFNPRLDRDYIARNTKVNGTWDDEENAMNGPSPFRQGRQFTLHILFAEDTFKFSCNGRHICSFAYRMPLARIKTLHIHGDLALMQVKQEMMREYPPPCDPVLLAALRREPSLLSVGHTALLLPTSETWTSEIPRQSFFFLGHFEPHLNIGSEIIIGGHVRLLPHGFFVNLQSGLQLWKAPDIHLHINPRFRTNDGHNEVVINAQLKGSWGFEERYHRCRFQPGMPFELSIYVDEERYLMFVNGAPLATMDHRARPSKVNSLYISGDVDITSVGFRHVADPKDILDKFSDAVGYRHKPFVEEELKRSDSPRMASRASTPEVTMDAAPIGQSTPVPSWKDRLISKLPGVSFLIDKPQQSEDEIAQSPDQEKASTDRPAESSERDKDGNSSSGVESTSAGPGNIPGKSQKFGEGKETITPNGRTASTEKRKVEFGDNSVNDSERKFDSTDSEVKMSATDASKPKLEEENKSVPDVASAPLPKAGKGSSSPDTDRPAGILGVSTNSMSGTPEHAREGAAGLLRKLPLDRDEGTPSDGMEEIRELTNETPVTRVLGRSRERKDEKILGTSITVPVTVSEEKLVSNLKMNTSEPTEREEPISEQRDSRVSKELISAETRRGSAADTENASPAKKVPRGRQKVELVSQEFARGSQDGAAPVVKLEDNLTVRGSAGASSVTAADLGGDDDLAFVTAEQSLAGSSTESQKTSDEAGTTESTLSGETNSNIKTDKKNKRSKK